jgi:alpha-galactosidase
MADEMLITQEKWLPQYKDAILEAKEYFKSDKVIPTNENYKGAARLKVKSIDEMKKDAKAAKENAQEADKAKKRAPEK